MDTVSIRRCTVVVSMDSSRTMPDWVKYGVFWHVYPLGFVGAHPADPPPTATRALANFS